MLSKLIKHVQRVLEMPTANYYAWTDSTIVLHWLEKPVKTFVSHRVASILESTSIRSWSHIDTKQNPADLVSRGLNVKELLSSEMWRHGPDWLRLSRTEWPRSKLEITPEIQDEVLKEVKPAEIFQIMSCAPLEGDRGPLLTRYSNWRKILRITAITTFHTQRSAERQIQTQNRQSTGSNRHVQCSGLLGKAGAGQRIRERD